MSAGLVGRLTALRESGGRGVLFTVVEGDGVGGKALVVEGGETLGDGVPPEALGQFDEIVRRGRNRLVETDGSKVFAEWYGPPPRLFVYGAVDTAEALCSGAKLLGWTAIVADARARVPHEGADPLRRPADRRVARGGARRDRARPPDRGRRPHPRRQVRRAGAPGGPRDRGLLHRRARLAPQPGAPPGAAARGGRLRGGARADPGAVRARHRRRHAGRDGALDPRRDPRRPRAAGAAGRSARRRSGSTSRWRSVDVAGPASACPGDAPKTGTWDVLSAPGRFTPCRNPELERQQEPTAGARGARARHERPGGVTARTRIPVERRSQRSASLRARRMPRRGDDEHLARSDAEDVVERVRHVVHGRPRVGVDDDLAGLRRARRRASARPRSACPAREPSPRGRRRRRGS